jgi:predicted transcriptional regulator
MAEKTSPQRRRGPQSEGSDRVEDLTAIREGLAQAEAGKTRPAEEFFTEFMKQHAIPG